jgi:hypothetical protein
MNVIGDIERLVAQLWPLRVPLAIVAIIMVAVIGYIAWRRGWYTTARAHPRASVVALAMVLAVAGPTGWILGSPLLVRTELVEPQVAEAASSSGDSTILAAGVWSGADEFHFGSGKASLVETADGGLRLNLEDFSVLNGPDLFVYVSDDPDGWNEQAVNLGPLKATDGSFSYEIPPQLSAVDIASAVVWCRAFGVLFASAPLVPA